MNKHFIFIIVLMSITVLGFGQRGDSMVVKISDHICKDCSGSKKLVLVSTGSKVMITKLGEYCFKVKYKNFTGWFPKSYLMTESDYQALKLKQEQALAESLRAENEAKAERHKAENEAKARVEAKKIIDSMLVRTNDFIYADSNGRVMMTFIPTGSKVKVIDIGTKYFKVNYKMFSGWFPKSFLVTEADYQALKLELQKKAAKAKANRIKAENDAIKARKDAINKRKADLTNKYGSQEIAEMIMAKKIWLGMTSAMAVESWGRPEDINRSVGAWGTHEQWVYGDTYLYFENGVLTSWQD